MLVNTEDYVDNIAENAPMHSPEDRCNKRHHWMEGYWTCLTLIYGERAADRIFDMAYEREREILNER